MSFTTFPLHGIIRDAAGVRCACRLGSSCDRVGKHPSVSWGALQPGEKRMGAHGHGIVTGHKSGVFVVDTDGAAADELFRSMGPLPPTYVVRTPRADGGAHYWFAWPGFPVKTGKSVLGPNIDVRGDGGFAVLPGSQHKNGGTYTIAVNEPVAGAPAWLLADTRIRGRITDGEPGENAPTPLDPASPAYAEHVTLGVEACESWDPHGGTVFFKLCIRLIRDLLLPVEEAHRLVVEHYQPRAVDTDGSPYPWKDGDIRRKLCEARDKSSIPAGNAHNLSLDAALVTKATPETWQPKVDPKSPAGMAAPKPLLQFGGWDRNPPPVAFLVDGILPKGCISKWFGHADSLKTWLLFSLAIAVSRGEPWLGVYPTKQCKVAIIDYETGKNNLHRRLYMLGAGDNPHLGAVSMPAAKTTDEALWTMLREADVGLVIIDSLRAGDGDLDENSSKEAIAPLRWAARYSEVSGAAVCFIHHAKKSSSGEVISRGASAIKDQVDCAFVIKADQESEERRKVTISCEKPGDMRKPADVVVDVTFDDSAHTVTLQTVAGGVSAFKEKSTADYYDILVRQGPFTSWQGLMGAWGLGKPKTESAFKALCEGRYAAFIDGEYRADTAELRRARVLGRVRELEHVGERCTSATLAKDASVYEYEVKALLDQKTIRSSGLTGKVLWSLESV